MSAWINALLQELDDRALDALADRLAPRLTERLRVAALSVDGWLDARAAAAYLGITLNALHKMTAARRIPFEQHGPGAKCYFKRSQLDAWRRREWRQP
jgi:excisionase family DNA binding protein